MRLTFARALRLCARYLENPRAWKVRRSGGIAGTFWKLDSPWFHQLSLRAVIDVGANEGQFSRTARALLPEANILAFEPIPECYQRVKTRFARDARFLVINSALGSEKGRAELTVASGDTGASSLLAVSDTQARYFPHTLNSRSITVDIDTLDAVVATSDLPGPYLLKIDVQGFEYEVLQGGMNTLANAAMVVLEASYERFYQGQKLFSDVYELLKSKGFVLSDTFNMMYAPDTGAPLQGDFIFLKQSQPGK